MLKQIRIITPILIAIFTVGCGGSAPAPPMAASNSYGTTASYESADAEYQEEPAEPTENTGRMIIRNASIEIESDDSGALYNGIANKAISLGGYESYHDINNFEAYSVINAELRIPAGKFTQLIDYINENGKVINSRVNSEDITEDYYDVEIRLNTKKASLDKYYELLGKAQNVEEIIQLQRTIDEITGEIESMEGRLRLWNNQVSMSTVSLLIRQQNDPVKIRKDINWNALSFSDMGYLIMRGFTRTVDYVIVIAQWLVIAAVSLSPLLAVLAVAYFVSKKLGLKPRKPKPRKNKKNEPPAIKSENIIAKDDSE